MLLKHKNSLQRYRLFTFLVGNGLFPPDAVLWIKAKDFVSGALIPDEYDAAAHREFMNFIRRTQNDPVFWRDASYYDLNLKRVVRNE